MDRLKRYFILIIFLAGVKYLMAQDTSTYEVIVVTNQPAYVPGDTIFFHAYLVDVEQQLDKNRRIAKLSLIDERQNIFNEINVLFDNGKAINQMAIPDQNLSTSLSIRFTFHGPNFDQIMQEIPVNLSMQEVNPKADSLLNQPYQNRLTGAPFKFKIQDETITTRDSIYIKLTPEESVPVDQLGGLSLNVLYGNPFPTLMDLYDMVLRFNIELLDKPQSRIIMTGIAYQPDGENILPANTQLIFYQQSTRQLYQSFVQDDGRFRLELLDFYDLDRLLIGADVNGRLLKNVYVIWDQPQFVPNYITQQPRDSENKSSYQTYRLKQQKINNSYEFFLNEDVFEVEDIKVPPIRIPADMDYDLMKYIVFEDVPELVKTVINALFYGEIEGKESIRIKFLEETLTDQDPLFFIDGIATFDTQKFLDLPTASLTSLKVVSDKRTLVRFGALGNHGIVIVETNQPREYPYLPHEIVTGLSPVQIKSNMHSISDIESKPIFRINTVWQPQLDVLQVFEEGVFIYTSDDAGTYQIIISGYQSEVGFFIDSTPVEIKPR